MGRIILLGCAGTGKTTFARRYAAKTGASLIHLDGIEAALKRSGQHDTFRERLKAEHAVEAWISDGNFALATFDIRLPRATGIVWLEAPRWLCLMRAARRPLSVVSDHRFTGLRAVFSYIWTFNAKARPRIEGALQKYGPNLPVIHLHNTAEVEAFLASA